MKLPNFVVIGAPKSGTTSLFFYLRQHPDVYLPVRKELHYFSYDFLAGHVNGPGDQDTLASLCATRKEYESHYMGVEDESAIGEVSPSYLYFSGTSEKIRKELGPVRIIALLRNPIEKAYSQYMHMVRDQRETLGFYDALMAEKEREEGNWGDIWLYAGSSLYADRIKRYLSVFGRDRMKIVLFDDLVNRTNDTMIKLFSFLGVDPTVKCDTSTVYNRSGQARSRMASDLFSKPNPIKSMAKLILPERIRIPLRLALLDWNTGRKNEMDKRSKEYLEEYFGKDIHDLGTLLNRPLNWLKR